MKLRLLVAAMFIVFIGSTYAGAATILETGGGIVGADGQWVIYDFYADQGPFTYRAMLTDQSTEPMNLVNMYLAITTSTAVIDSAYGEEVDSLSFNFPVEEGRHYLAKVFAQGAGPLSAGHFGLDIQSVPIPSTLLLLGGGLVGLVGIRKKLKSRG